MHYRTLSAHSNAFEHYFLDLRNTLAETPSVNVGEWQSQHDQQKFMMKELLHVAFEMPMPSSATELGKITGARLPWAEDHFDERVSGVPHNPAPSEAWWPFRQKKDGNTNTDHKSEGEAFSHTYPERMWPKYANVPMIDLAENDPLRDPELRYQYENHGIRFEFGDLRDVVKQLVAHPFTRQAYLPIWFPEDTGAVHGKRVPCTLGYHFIIRDGRLDVSYFMRSTDLLRHFQDDVYMAIRLGQWMVQEVNSAVDWEMNKKISYLEPPVSTPPNEQLQLGKLVFHTANLHIFEGDAQIINFWKSQGKTWF